MLTRRSVCFGSLAALASAQGPEPAIIPRPARLSLRNGAFRLSNQTRIMAAREARPVAEALASSLGIRMTETSGRGGVISLEIDPGLSRLGSEGYSMAVTPDHVAIRAAAPAGIFFATQSLRQLLPADVFGTGRSGSTEWTVPALEIEDSPRFRWRGGLIDVARHFIPKAAILKYIDALSIHKINTMQMHLTDDQGWRIEIKKYPRLTEIGARRNETRVGHESKAQGFDAKPHGGFYSQEDLREIVAYAAARHINIVPEVEMPGHAQAALAAYPEYGASGEKVDVWTQWGISRNIFGVEEKTFEFLKDVLSEVLEIFPSPYIHVGGDEVPPDQWKKSPRAQKRIQELGLKGEAGLHTWFIGRINEFIKSRGRTLVGWDEIIEGGMTPGAVVMSWRGDKGGIEAARHGHDVVMTPNNYTYFDYYQASPEKEPLAIGGMITLEKAYNFEPVPAELSGEEARRVLGTQGQLWSEYISTPEHMQYMAFPRMCALAEVAWTPGPRRDFADFMRRLPVHLPRLTAMGVNYRKLQD